MSSMIRSAFQRENPVLGTPVSPTATRIMMLGSGELGKEVIIALQRLGVEVIAVDRYANAPGHAVAHHAHVIDMSNPQALRELIEKEAPDCIVPEIEAIATEVLIECEAEGYTVVPTARAAWMTMNREHIRKLAAETLDLPTSAYRFAGSREELHQAAAELQFPCFVKPVMSSSGKGQSCVTSVEELDAAWEYASIAGRIDSGRVIVEHGIHFDFEITLLTVRYFDAQGALETAFCEPIGHRQVAGDYVESWQPQAMSSEALQSAQTMAKAVTAELGGLGIFGVEFFVKGEQVWFSEVSPRPHDTGMVTLKSQVQNEFEIHARAILGLPVNVRLNTPAASAIIYGGMDAEAIRYSGLREALADPDVDIRLFGKPVAFPRRRMGVALASAKTVEAARAQAVAAAASVHPHV